MVNSSGTMTKAGFQKELQSKGEPSALANMIAAFQQREVLRPVCYTYPDPVISFMQFDLFATGM